MFPLPMFSNLLGMVSLVYNHDSSSVPNGTVVHSAVGNLDALGQAISKLGDARQDLVSRKHSARLLLRCTIPDAYRRDR